MVKMVNFMLSIFYHNKNKYTHTHSKRGSYKSSSKEKQFHVNFTGSFLLKRKRNYVEASPEVIFKGRTPRTSFSVTDTSVSMNILL